jgi:hypothetical protein
VKGLALGGRSNFRAGWLWITASMKVAERPIVFLNKREASFDGLYCAGPDGKLYEVFAPRWWRLDRWIRWGLVSEVDRGELKVAWLDGFDSGAVVLRARLVREPEASRHY